MKAYLTVLANLPDTLIARKRGLEMAHRVTARAQTVLKADGVFSTKAARRLYIQP